MKALFLHSAYSRVLALSDYHLFRSMQHILEDTHFYNYEDKSKIRLLNGLAQKTGRSFVAEFNFSQKSGKSHSFRGQIL